MTGYHITWADVRRLLAFACVLYGVIAVSIGYFALHVPFADHENAAWVVAVGAILILCGVLVFPYRG